MMDRFDYKRLVAAAIALLLVFALLPGAAFAQEPAENTNGQAGPTAPLSDETKPDGPEETPAPTEPEPSASPDATPPEAAPAATPIPSQEPEPSAAPGETPVATPVLSQETQGPELAAQQSEQEEQQPHPEPDPNEGVLYVEGEVLVVFEDTATVQAVENAVAQSFAEPEHAITASEIRNEEPVLVGLDETTTVARAVEELSADPNVLIAQPNYLYHAMESAEELEAMAVTINDPLQTQQWHLSSIGMYDAWEIQKAKEDGLSGQPVRVAVLDSGINLTHEDLVDNIDFAHAMNYAVTPPAPLTGDGSSGSHGSHVAGIISAAANNGKGGAGVSYNAQIVPVNVYYDGLNATTNDVVNAMEYVMGIEGVRVINMSFGGTAPGFDEDTDTLLHGKIKEAYEKGIISVCAGGNAYTDAFVFPGDYRECTSVVAINSSNVRANCAYNQYKDISAPGVDILSAGRNSNSSYIISSGTSMAAPMVSGVAALLFAQNPSFSVADVQEVLYNTADDLGAPGRDDFYGWGKVNAAKALEHSGISVLSPKNVAAAVYDAASIRISWNTVPNADGYRVYRSEQAGGEYQQVSGDITAALSFMDNTASLTRNKTFYYKVLAYKSDVVEVKSNFSTVVQAAIPARLAAPTGIMATPNGPGEIKVSWKALPGAQYYNVYRAPSGAGPWTKVAQAGESSASYADKAIGARGITLYYYVTAVTKVGIRDAADESPRSGVVSGTIPKALGMPASVSAEALEGMASIKVSWSAVPGANGYDVYRVSGGGARVKVHTAPASAVSYTDTGLARGKAYTYYISAYLMLGTQKEAGPEKSGSAVLPAAMPAPANVVTDISGNWDVKLSWGSIASAEGYEIYRAESATGGFVKIAIVPGVSFTDLDTVKNKIYYYKVRAYKAVGAVRDYSPQSTAVCVSLVDKMPAPSVAVKANDALSASVSWKTVPGALGYEVARAESAGGAYKAVYTTNTESIRSFQDTGVLAGTTYYYKIRAIRRLNGKPDYGNYSLPAAAKPMPLPVSGIEAKSGGYNRIMISWVGTTDASGYFVYSAPKASGAYEKVADIATNMTVSYTHKGLKTGTAYYYKIAPYRLAGVNKVEGERTALASAKPLVPAPATIKAVKAGYDGAKVSWGKAADASGYYVYRSARPVGVFRLVATTKATKRSFADKGLKTGTEYYYKVIPFRNAGTKKVKGAASEVASAQPALNKVSGIVVKSAGRRAATVRWKKTEGAGGYDVWRALGDGTYKRVKTLAGNETTSFKNSRLRSSKVYSYRVRAYRKVGSKKIYGAWSAVKRIRIK